MLLELLQRLGCAALHAEIGQRPGPIDGILAPHCQRGMRLCEREELFRLEEDVFRRQDGPLLVVLQEAMALTVPGLRAQRHLLLIGQERT